MTSAPAAAVSASPPCRAAISRSASSASTAPVPTRRAASAATMSSIRSWANQPSILRLHRRDGTGGLAGRKASDQGFDFGGRRSRREPWSKPRARRQVWPTARPHRQSRHGSRPGRSWSGRSIRNRCRSRPANATAARCRRHRERSRGRLRASPVSSCSVTTRWLAVRRQPDAAAHHDAVHEGDIGLWEFLDAGVEDVFLAPQDLAEIALAPSSFPRARGCRRRRKGRARRRLPAGSPQPRDRPRTRRAPCRCRGTSPASRH